MRKSVASVQNIIFVVANYYGVTARQIESRDRHRYVAHARMTAMYLARELTGLSLMDIGGLIGDRDHTTVLHATREVAQRMIADETYCKQVGILKARLTPKEIEEFEPVGLS